MFGDTFLSFLIQNRVKWQKLYIIYTSSPIHVLSPNLVQAQPIFFSDFCREKIAGSRGVIPL